MNNELINALEICLQELDRGKNVQEVLAQFPELAVELRPLLKTAQLARNIPLSSPSEATLKKGRAQLLQRAAEMREKRNPVRKPAISLLQRFALTSALLITLLGSGTGLVSASSSALPGENLYPLKRTWEGFRLFFVFDDSERHTLESEYEQERLDEVGELLAAGHDADIKFSGLITELNNQFYISGIPVAINGSTVGELKNGAVVTVSGRTDANGVVILSAIETLPSGSVVPLGEQIEVEDDSSSGVGPAQGTGPVARSTSEAGGQPVNRNEYHLSGQVESFNGTQLLVNGETIYLDKTLIEGIISNGSQVEVVGYYSQSGQFIAVKIKVENESPAINKDDQPENNSGEESGSDSGDDGSDP